MSLLQHKLKTCGHEGERFGKAFGSTAFPSVPRIWCLKNLETPADGAIGTIVIAAKEPAISFAFF